MSAFEELQFKLKTNLGCYQSADQRDSYIWNAALDHVAKVLDGKFPHKKTSDHDHIVIRAAVDLLISAVEKEKV